MPNSPAPVLGQGSPLHCAPPRSVDPKRSVEEQNTSQGGMGPGTNPGLHLVYIDFQEYERILPHLSELPEARRYSLG